MSSAKFRREFLTDAGWWHWALTVPLVAAHLAGHRGAILAVMALCGVAGVYFYARIRQIKPYPVQVRIAYLAWTFIGTLPGMQWMHWIQLFGTTAMITVGYCPLIRMLGLLPFNRSEPLTRALVWRVFMRDPCAGGIVHWSERPAGMAGASCSLPTPITDFTESKEVHHAQAH